MMSCVGMGGFSVAKGGLSDYDDAMKFRVLIEPDEDGPKSGPGKRGHLSSVPSPDATDGTSDVPKEN